MKLKAIVFGSTGMIGQGVLLECLESNEVESVLVVNRHSCGLNHHKLTEIIHQDFYDLSSIENELKGYNTCFFCLGVSSVGLSEEEYSKITFDLTTYVAGFLLKINPEITFCYISGKGTDSSEKGRMMWARVKGKTENALLSMPFKQVYLFRPGYIQPLRGIKSRTRLYNVIYFLFKPFYFLLRLLKNAVTNTSELGKAMINSAAHGYGRKILETIDINNEAKD